MMDKQKRDSLSFTSPGGKSIGFKIPKKKPDDWCEEVHTNSPLTRLGSHEFRNVTFRKRPCSSSYESYNVPRNKETHAYYTSPPGSSKCMRQARVILTDILRSGSGSPSARNNVTDSNPINSISSPTSNNAAQQVLQGSPGNLCLSRTEQILSLHKESEKKSGDKFYKKRTSVELKEQAQEDAFSTVCRDVSNTTLSPQKDVNLGVKKTNCEEGGANVSKASNLECKNLLKNNKGGSPDTREKTYCYKRAEYQNKRTSTSTTNVTMPSSPSSSSESITTSPLKSSDTSIGDRVTRTSREHEKSSTNRSSVDPIMSSLQSYSNRLCRKKKHLQDTSKGNLPLEPIVLSSDEEEREHEERVIMEHQQKLAETSVKMKEDDTSGMEYPVPCSDVQPMDCSDDTIDLPSAAENLELQLKFLNVYFGKKKGAATDSAKVTPKCIEIPITVPLEPCKHISLDTMKLQKLGLWLTNGGDSVRSSAVIIFWITTEYIPHIEKQMGSTSRNPASKSNELVFLELVEPLTDKEQSFMLKIMKEASENGGLGSLADFLTWDEMYSMVEALSSEDCSFKANCGIAFKKQQQQESSNTSPSVGSPQKYKDGRYSVSMVPRQEDSLKEVDKGRTLLRLLVYPPPPTKGGLAVTNEDLECLEHGEFLNDVIIDFYLKYLLLEKFPEPFAEKCHVFSSFFFGCLTRKDKATHDSNSEMPAAQRRHHRVKTWTRHVDIFAKDFIFVPVNENSHWYLVVICFPWLEKAVYEDRKEPSTIQDSEKIDGPNSGSVIVFNDRLSKKEETLGDGSNSESEGSASSGVSCSLKHSKHKDKHHGKLCKRPCLLIFDSLRSGSAQATVQVLREYLKAEWDVKRKTPREFSRSSFRDLYPKVPKQNNSTDCGLYVLQYVESFAQKPIESFDPPMHLENWFPASVVKNKRDKIRNLILRLHFQQSKKS
ncbi:sentrin-specific protease 7 isoform 2-T3 [Leptodactylus fuscus]|uniref:sentrin-specific protease 7 isoform X2 n=1 Tax=Leptodactylus fuscus TaxID=238119 RepID=UPI003F4EF895